jgi:hypothetical protein
MNHAMQAFLTAETAAAHHLFDKASDCFKKALKEVCVSLALLPSNAKPVVAQRV